MVATHVIGACPDAVRPDNGELHGQVDDGPAVVVPYQRGEADRLARPVDAAVGVEIGLHRTRRGAAAHAPVREIETGTVERQERMVAVSGVCPQENRLASPRSAQQPGCECPPPVCIGCEAGEGVFVAGLEGKIHPRQGFAGGKGARKDGQAVGPAHGQEPDVRDHEPLDGAVAVAPVHLVRGGGGQDVHSGFALGYEGVYGNGGEHLTVPAAVDGKGVLPDLLAQLLDDPACRS